MKRLMILSCIIAILLCSCGTSESEPQKNSSEINSSSAVEVPETAIVNVKNIFGKNPDEVKEILGEPTMEDGKDIYYKDMQINVCYIDDKAATVSVELLNDLKMVSENYNTFFNYVGISFDGQEPSNTAPICTEWNYIDDIYQVSLFAKSVNDNTAKSIYVISKEEYKK